MKFKDLPYEDKWYINSANTMRGVLQRAKEKDCDFDYKKNINCEKIVTTSQLIKMQQEKLIADFNVSISPNGINIIIKVEFNDGSILETSKELKIRI